MWFVCVWVHNSPLHTASAHWWHYSYVSVWFLTWFKIVCKNARVTDYMGNFFFMYGLLTLTCTTELFVHRCAHPELQTNCLLIEITNLSGSWMVTCSLSDCRSAESEWHTNHSRSNLRSKHDGNSVATTSNCAFTLYTYLPRKKDRSDILKKELVIANEWFRSFYLTFSTWMLNITNSEVLNEVFH